MDFFAAAYKGRPPWDIGRPQKEFVALVQKKEITSPVLDIGCGTGDNALFFAAEGFDVVAIDAAQPAIEKAKEKAGERGISVDFLVMNALEAAELKRAFSTVTDSGFFHTLSDDDRTVFEKNLASVLPPEGKYFMLCFSDKEPGGYGPRRVTEQEIRETFSQGWDIRYIRPAVFESNTRAGGSRAWLASIVKK